MARLPDLVVACAVHEFKMIAVGNLPRAAIFLIVVWDAGLERGERFVSVKSC
jgi:hypothetical protein